MTQEITRRMPGRCGIWKKFKPVTSDKWLRHLLENYLDEETKLIPSSGGKLASSLRKERVSPDIPFNEGLYVFGHLSDTLRRRGINPPLALRREAVPILSDWWTEERSKSVIKAHHITASFHPRITELLTEKGYPADAMLLATVHSTLSEFSAKFYPDKTVGWIAGCHHDKAHPHLHALVHPTDSSGKLIRMSGLKQGEKGVDVFEFLSETFNHRAQQLYVGMTHSKEIGQNDPGLNPWLLLAREAHLRFASVDSAERNSHLVLSEMLTAEPAAERLEVPLRNARNAFILEKDSPSIESSQVIAERFSSISERWDGMRKEHKQKARNVLSHRETISGRPEYSPNFLTGGRILPLNKLDYAERIIGGSQTGFDVEEALNERLLDSKVKRERFMEKLRDYRESTLKMGAETADFEIFGGFMVTKIAIQKATVMNQPEPFFLHVPQDSRGYSRRLLNMEKVRMVADREMAILASTEAAKHLPVEPSQKPSIMAAPYLPTIQSISDTAGGFSM